MQKSLHTDQHRVLCELLRELRTEAKLTQVQLAEAIDEPQSMVSRVEVGQRRLDILELRQWLAALGVPLAESAVILKSGGRRARAESES